MAAIGSEFVEARILYWGIEGSGKSTNLATIQARLRPDARGELREVATRLDPTATYEMLPIELGEVRGVRTRVQVIAVPGAPEQSPTRKQLLDEVDGVVLVVDSRSERIDDNLRSFDELRQGLAAYGRSLDTLPLVVQYNKHDLADPVSLDALHRKLDIPGAAVFETVANEAGGAGVLRTLTTISKRVMRGLREQAPASGGAPAPPAAPAAVPAPPAPPVPAPPPPAAAPPATGPALMEEAILRAGDADAEREVDQTVRQAEAFLDRPWSDLEEEAKGEPGLRISSSLRIVSVGPVTHEGTRGLRIPLVLGDDGGETATLCLRLALDPLLDGETP